MLAGPPPAAPPLAPRSEDDARAFVRGLQRRHGGRLEERARAAAACMARWVAAGIDTRLGGRTLPGPARQAIAAAVLEAAFRLWPPTLDPRV